MEERKALGIVHPKDGEEVYRQRCMVKGWGEPKTEYILSVKRFPEISSFDRTRGAPMLPEVNYKVKTVAPAAGSNRSGWTTKVAKRPSLGCVLRKAIQYTK